MKWVAGASVLSAIKMAEDGEAMVVRAYNPSETDDEISFELNADLAGTVLAAAEADLLERETGQGRTAAKAGRVTATIPARAIWTARLKIQPPR